MVTKKTHSYSDSILFLKKQCSGVRKALLVVLAKSRKHVCHGRWAGFPHTCSHLHKVKRPLGAPLSPSLPRAPALSWAHAVPVAGVIWPNLGTDCPPRPEFRTQQRGESGPCPQQLHRWPLGLYVLRFCREVRVEGRGSSRSRERGGWASSWGQGRPQRPLRSRLKRSGRRPVPPGARLPHAAQRRVITGSRSASSPSVSCSR